MRLFYIVCLSVLFSFINSGNVMADEYEPSKIRCDNRIGECEEYAESLEGGDDYQGHPSSQTESPDGLIQDQEINPADRFRQVTFEETRVPAQTQEEPQEENVNATPYLEYYNSRASAEEQAEIFTGGDGFNRNPTPGSRTITSEEPTNQPSITGPTRRACDNAGLLEGCSQADIDKTQAAYDNQDAIKAFDEKYNQCIQKEYPSAERCCGENLIQNGCNVDGVQELAQGLTTITQTLSAAASYNSVAAQCKAQENALKTSAGLTILAAGLCTKSAGTCLATCTTSKARCEEMYPKESLQEQVNANSPYGECLAKVKTMNARSRGCGLFQFGNAAKTWVSHEATQAQKNLNTQCNETVANASELTCNTQEDIATNPDCGPAELCAQAGNEDLEICKDQTINTGVAQAVPDSIDNASNGDSIGDGTGNGSSAFANPDEEQGVDPLAGLGGANQASTGGDSGAGGGGGGAPSLGGGGGSGGSGGARGKAGPGKDRNILRGTSSGNGYVGRSGRGGSGGGYRTKSYRKSSGSTARAPKFNLKQFLPKSKKITKGRLKGYNRLPSGNLMVPQNLDIFDVHHRSYQNACKRGPIIKGCGPKASKKLGFAPTVRDLNSRYKAQLALQKEAQKQRLSRSGLRVQSLKNNISLEANITYYQIQYMNKNKLRSLPAQDPVASLTGKKSRKGQDWQKMQSWVNSKTGRKGGFTKPTSSRIPASVK